MYVGYKVMLSLFHKGEREMTPACGSDKGSSLCSEWKAESSEANIHRET